jgi:ribose transport system substrate-binding protein
MFGRLRQGNFRPFVILVALALVACGETTTTGATGKTPIHLAFFVIKGNSYNTAAYNAGIKVARASGATWQSFDTTFDAKTEYNLIQDAITTKRFNGFVMESLDGAVLGPVIRQAIAAGIAVGSFDNPTGTDHTTPNIQIQGQAASVLKPGTTEGQDEQSMISQACRGIDPCKVGYIFGFKSLPNDYIRFLTAELAAQFNPNIHFVAQADGQYLAGPAQTAAQDMLLAHPDMNVIATSGDQMSVGIEKAVIAANLVGKVKILGAGASQTGVAKVRSGAWFGTTLYLPEAEGAEATKVVVQWVQGQKVPMGVDTMDLRGNLPRVLTINNKDQWANFNGQWSG